MRFKFEIIQYLLLILSILHANKSICKNIRGNSDFDILHYNIHLDISDITTESISGYTDVKFRSTSAGLNKISLMLESLQVDSIIQGMSPLTFTYNSPDLAIDLNKSINKGDSVVVRIYYHGNPIKDSQWGGFYFSDTDDGYAYNMGVGFVDSPHNYGRVWFPCVDNFTDKAFYDFYITTALDKKAVCSGTLMDTNRSGNLMIWHWQLKQEVPTYLVSVAIGNYELLQSNYQGVAKQLKILNACHPKDTAKFRGSFSKLTNCIDIYEKYYCPYYFDRVGFVVVPFNAGAMEHATNIAYPQYAVNGNLTYETLIAHEFSHHWWGNLVTCKTAEDMWINEGWASYSEYLYLEKQYGIQKYRDEIQTNHKQVLQYAHVRDDDIYPLSPVPHEVTYGTHVYDKGADVVHTLRSYLGDSLFFAGVNLFLENMKFGNASSYDLRDSLSKYTATDLTDFFNDWVFRKGFPHFFIENIDESQFPEVKILLRNTPRFNVDHYLNVPLEILFYNNDWSTHKENVSMSWGQKEIELSLPFKPAMVIVDPERKISDARTMDEQKITATGNYNLPNALMEVDVDQLNDSALLIVEHHWNGPEIQPSNISGIRFSDYRYWTVHGIFPSTFNAVATIKYNGSTSGSLSGSNYLDHTLNIENEDSLLLVYRESPDKAWEEYDDYEIITGSLYNKTGSIEINNLKKGDYCLAKYDITGSTPDFSQNVVISVYPNPAKSEIQVDLNQSKENFDSYKIVNSKGEVLINKNLILGNAIKFHVNHWPAGTYIIELSGPEKVINKKFVISK